MAVDEALDRLLVRDDFRRNLTLDHLLPARPARYAPFPADLDPRLAHALAERGVTRPYTHQVEAADRALRCADVVVVTPTDSGTPPCYHLPALAPPRAHADSLT